MNIQEFQILTLLHSFIIGFCLSTIQSFPWSIFLIPLRVCGIRVYQLTRRAECERIQRRTNSTSSLTTDQNRGAGYSVSFWQGSGYICYIDPTKEEPNAWLLTTETCFKNLTRSANEEDDEEVVEEEMVDHITGEITLVSPKYMTLYEKAGSYTHTWYNFREHKHFDWVPRPAQEPILQDLLTLYAEKRFVVALVHGPPCTGKSLLGLLLAHHFKGSYTNTFRPWIPGATMTELMDTVEPSREKPLIISLDEIDVPLSKIHVGIQPHKEVDTVIHDKVSWNCFFDNFQRGLYHNVIVLMTSNRGPAFFDSLDPSYMRAERVDRVYEMPARPLPPSPPGEHED